jgi:hypothetical protein
MRLLGGRFAEAILKSGPEQRWAEEPPGFRANDVPEHVLRVEVFFGREN